VFPNAPELLQWWGRVARFVAVGGLATAVHYALLTMAVEWGNMPEVAASALGFCIAAAVNYFLNYHLTFAGAGRGIEHRQALPRFVLVAGAGLALNILCISVLLLFMHYLLAQAGATLLTLTFNFLLHQFWIYKVDSWNS